MRVDTAVAEYAQRLLARCRESSMNRDDLGAFHEEVVDPGTISNGWTFVQACATGDLGLAQQVFGGDPENIKWLGFLGEVCAEHWGHNEVRYWARTIRIHDGSP